MSMTPDEAEIYACALRRVADLTDRVVMLQRWAKNLPLDDMRLDMRWLPGSGMKGYDEMTKLVAQMVAPQLPELIKKAILQAEVDLHIASRQLPNGQGSPASLEPKQGIGP